jgi:Bax protein
MGHYTGYFYFMKCDFLSCSRICIMTIVAMLWGCDGTATYEVRTEMIKVNSVSQIVMLNDSLVRPILYSNVMGLEHLPFYEAKAKFISAILPSILVAKHRIHNTRNRIETLSTKSIWNESDSLYYSEMKRRYKARDIQDLKGRLVTLPNSVVLAQAAIETGWGESRFFKQASNLFGIWSFDANESRIAAGKNRSDNTIFLRSYDDMSGSIDDYFEVLARHHAYRGLRKARLTTSNPYALVPHLRNYSERKGWYTRQLKRVIRQNKLTKYDRYRIDPNYLVLE